jgi:hypothetical protein
MYVKFETEGSAGRWEGYSDLHNTVDEHDVARVVIGAYQDSQVTAFGSGHYANYVLDG